MMNENLAGLTFANTGCMNIFIEELSAINHGAVANPQTKSH